MQCGKTATGASRPARFSRVFPGLLWILSGRHLGDLDLDPQFDLPQHGVEAGLRLCYGHPCATPELMQRWNLDLTVPFADWRLGTTYRGPPPR